MGSPDVKENKGVAETTPLTVLFSGHLGVLLRLAVGVSNPSSCMCSV